MPRNPAIPLSNGDQAIIDKLCCLIAAIENQEPPIVGIENGLLSRCYENAAGEPVDVEVVRSEDGSFVGYTLHAISGTTDVPDLSSLFPCSEPPDYIDIQMCAPSN